MLFSHNVNWHVSFMQCGLGSRFSIMWTGIYFYIMWTAMSAFIPLLQ